MIVQDNVVGFPALGASGRPWVRIVSCNPAELKDERVPPVFSGYPTDARRGSGRSTGRSTGASWVPCTTSTTSATASAARAPWATSS